MTYPDSAVTLIDLLHKRCLDYEVELEQSMDIEAKEQLKGVILGLKEAIEIIAKEDRSKVI